MTARQAERITDAIGARESSAGRLFLPALIVIATLAAYASSFDGVFLLDDHRAIVQNRALRNFSDFGAILSGRRPIVDLTLAINYAVGGATVGGYHAVNLLIHILAALTLYGLIRRTLSAKRRGPRDPGRATWLAGATALLWALHPLQTESVTYLIQRSESLMALFYLLTLYGLVRHEESGGRVRWAAVAVICCGLGMGSKAVMVTAPVVAVLFDTFLVAGSLRRAMQRRWGLHACLFATWIVLFVNGVVTRVLFPPSDATGHVGFAFRDIGLWEYAATQLGVSLRYISLAFWPSGLCLDYAWPVTGSVVAIVLPGLIVVFLLGMTVWAFLRRSAVGFLAAAFFVILSPTSSFIPIKDTMFEHRMYLPLATLASLVVICGARGLSSLTRSLGWSGQRARGTSVAVVAIAAAALGLTTLNRNATYRSPVAMWQDVVNKRPTNARALNRLGASLAAGGDIERGIDVFRTAARRAVDDAESRSNLCAWLYRSGETAEALAYCREAIQLEPDFGQAHFNLGLALFRVGKANEAIEALHEAARLMPRNAVVQFTLGEALDRMGMVEPARKAYERAIELDPENRQARENLAALSTR